MPSPLVIKVNETPSSFIKEGGFKGYVLDQQVVSWDNVLASASRKLNLSPNLLGAYFDTVMDTALEGIEADGHTRQLGNYLELAVGVRGGFRKKGGRFDANEHRLKLNLLPLTRFRQFRPAFDVRIENRAPLVVLSSLHSVSTPGKEMLNFGEEMILSGKNLWNCPYAEEKAFENMYVKYSSIYGDLCCTTISEWEAYDNGTKIRVPWPMTRVLCPRMGTERPFAIEIELVSRAGIPDANAQRHKIKVKVDPSTWSPS